MNAVIVTLSVFWFAALLGVLAFDFGLFKLPFDAEIQKVVKGPKLNIMLAYFNMVSFAFMLLASGCYAYLSVRFGPRFFLLFLGLDFLVTPVAFTLTYRKVLLFVGTRQLAYNICRGLPPNVEVVGVRTRGLWGSVWSRAGRTSSPKLIPTLVKSMLLWLFCVPFLRRRPVTMQVENLTERAWEWAKLPRLEFNRKLEEWYNT